MMKPVKLYVLNFQHVNYNAVKVKGNNDKTYSPKVQNHKQFEIFNNHTYKEENKNCTLHSFGCLNK